MFILIGIIVALIISTIELLVFRKKVTIGNSIYTVLKNIFVITVTSIGIVRYVFKMPHFLITDGLATRTFVKFFILSLVVGLAFLFAYGVINRYLTFEEEENKKGKGVMALKIVSVVLVFTGFICAFLTDWTKGEYGDLPIDQVLITYIAPTTGSDMIDYTDLIEGPIFKALFLTMIFVVFVFSNLKIVYRNREKIITVFNDFAHRIISIVLAVLILISGIFYSVNRFDLISLYNAYFVKSDIIDKNFVDPRTANLKFPEKKRNLIHIYLESMENSYMSKDLGGFMDENLIPELTEIAREGYSFSHLDDKFGGPHPTVGTTWSAASMVNMSSGLPMKPPKQSGAYGSEETFLPGTYTLGEILEKEGYEQTVMFGADADFGGLTYYFKAHGNYKIMDYKYAKENGLIPPDYFVWWGFEDDKLYEFAKDELTRLANTGKPFNFVMENADTHRPNGYLSEKAPKPYPNPYANALSYSSSEVEKFLRWIQEQPFYENTTVVIIGDHLSMESNFFNFYNFDKNYQRSQYNVILNPAPGVAPKSKDILFNRVYANFDMFPTILTSMGVKYDGHRLGIGTDLFSGEKTIFEEYGFEKAHKELIKKSVFYNEQILVDPTKAKAEKSK